MNHSGGGHFPKWKWSGKKSIRVIIQAKETIIYFFSFKLYMRYIKRKYFGFFLYFYFSCTFFILGISVVDIICIVHQMNRTPKIHESIFSVHNKQIKAKQIVDRLNFFPIKFENIYFFPVRIFTKSESMTPWQRWVVVVHIYLIVLISPLTNQKRSFDSFRFRSNFIINSSNTFCFNLSRKATYFSKFDWMKSSNESKLKGSVWVLINPVTSL